MPLSIRTMLALLAAAVVLLAVVALDVTGRSEDSRCADANAAVGRGLLAQADTGYDAILAGQPDDQCALQGKRAVAEEACRRARAAMAGGAHAAARKEFEALFAREPPNARICATAALRDPKPPQPGPGERLTVVVRGTKGDRGPAGEKGPKGDPGKQQKEIIRETRTIIYCNVTKRWRCRTVG